MPQFSYDTDDLWAGSRHAATAADRSAAAGRALGTGPSPSPFGSVPAAAALHGAVAHAHRVHALAATHISAALHTRSARVRSGAALGEENTAETTQIVSRP